jgi:hypothetical protein
MYSMEESGRASTRVPRHGVSRITTTGNLCGGHRLGLAVVRILTRPSWDVQSGSGFFLVVVCICCFDVFRLHGQSAGTPGNGKAGRETQVESEDTPTNALPNDAVRQRGGSVHLKPRAGTPRDPWSVYIFFTFRSYSAAVGILAPNAPECGSRPRLTKYFAAIREGSFAALRVKFGPQPDSRVHQKEWGDRVPISYHFRLKAPLPASTWGAEGRQPFFVNTTADFGKRTLFPNPLRQRLLPCLECRPKKGRLNLTAAGMGMSAFRRSGVHP